MNFFKLPPFKPIPKKPGLYAYLPAIIYMIFITVLLLMPASDLPKNPFLELIYFDKWIHFCIFCMLCFLWALPGVRYFKHPVRHLIIIAAFCTAYGIITEYAQKNLTIDRSFDQADIIADASGVVLGCIALLYLKKKAISISH